MKLNDRHKICSNCDGKIAQEAVICPFCSHDLSHMNTTTREGASEAISASLYSPPYVSSNKGVTPTPSAYTQKQPTEGVPVQEEVPVKQFYMPLFALIAGSNLLLIGLMQLLFGEGGKLSLEWDTSYAFLFFLFALPLLGIGAWRMRKNKGNTEYQK